MVSQNRVIDPRAAERRRSILMWAAAAIVLIVVAAVIIVATTRNGGSNNAADEGNTPNGTATPTVVTDNAIRVSAAPADSTPPVVVTVTEDFQCPACAVFERTLGPALASFHSNPAVAVDYVAVNMLDRASTTQYSTRAANASLCVAEKTADQPERSTWLEYHNLLFANQPAEGGAGLPNAELISLAKDVGVEGVDDCITNRDFGEWVQTSSADAMSQPGFEGTPNVRINGEVIRPNDAADLQAQINAAIEAAQ